MPNSLDRQYHGRSSLTMSGTVTVTEDDHAAAVIVDVNDYETASTIASTPDCDYGHSSSFFVFIVGINDEWRNDDGRGTDGDVAMWEEYLEFGVPSNQVVFLRDEKATKSACEERLVELLASATRKSTLVFYFGGRGSATGFCTFSDGGDDQPYWRYRDVIRSVKEHFEGERVILLADCSGSGGLGFELQSPPPQLLPEQHPLPTASFVCIMSVPSYFKAGPEWTLTSAWIEAMECSDGKLSLFTVLDFLSDEMARYKGNLLSVYLSPCVNVDSCSWLPHRPKLEKKCSLKWRHLRDHVPFSARVGNLDCTVGNRVCYKHPGRTTDLASPLWLNATVQGKSADGTLQLLVEDTQSGQKWEVSESKSKLLNEVYTASFNLIPTGFQEAQCRLAKAGRYVDFSCAPRKPVTVTLLNGQQKDGIILDWREVQNWEVMVESFFSEETTETTFKSGPVVAVAILQYGQKKLLLVARQQVGGLVVESPMSNAIEETAKMDDVDSDEKTNSAAIQASDQRTAILKSIESSGKTICDAYKVLGVEDLMCFWPETGFYSAEPLRLDDVSLQALTSHCHFTLTGPYCPVHFSEDDTDYLVPLSYLRSGRCGSFCKYGMSRLCLM